MTAQQTQLDVISHNLANVSTNGFKRNNAVFEDLIYQNLRQVGSQTTEENQLPTGLHLGLGVNVVATSRNFTQGSLQQSGNSLDVAIDGNGFFEVTLPDGTQGYTRDGSFKLDSDRRLVTTDGYPLADNITIDANAPSDSITISSDGRVSDTPAGGTQQEVGQIQLARFVNPSGLTAIGKNLSVVSEASGDAIEGEPGVDGARTLTQGTLEMSSVQIVEEMVNMIISQRAYESNSKAVTTSDSMLEIANGLKR